jgi:hypothetical protein
MFEKLKQLFVVDFKRTHFVEVQIKFTIFYNMCSEMTSCDIWKAKFRAHAQ